ncbi:hypothetical protein G6554_14955 [Bacillus sp. MM2020_4]|nr:hypothetical protein [Bacillus sp. MM2020_4]
MKQFYYEFNENEYYGLIAVSVEEDDLKTNPYKKATEFYVEYIGGETVEEVLDEAHPNLRTKEYAFMKFMYAPNHLDDNVKILIEQFEETTNGVLLIDGSLI